MEPVQYTVSVTHWHDGDIDVMVNDVGDSEQDRKAVAFALRKAAELVESGLPRKLS